MEAKVFLPLQGGGEEGGWGPRITDHESRFTNHESRSTNQVFHFNSTGLTVRVYFSDRRSTVTSTLVCRYASVSSRCSSSMLATGLPSHATITSPSANPASAAGLPDSTDMMRTPLSTVS